jgi:hypothetical protein
MKQPRALDLGRVGSVTERSRRVPNLFSRIVVIVTRKMPKVTASILDSQSVGVLKWTRVRLRSRDVAHTTGMCCAFARQ